MRFHASDLWITCALRYKDWWHEQWRPHHFTWLFFHDEAVSFAAGHRPCALCRRAAYDDYRDAWSRGLDVDVPSAKEINRRLHSERIVRGTHRRRLHALPWSALPDGTFVVVDDEPAVVVGDALRAWGFEGYGARRARPRTGTAQVITPPSTVAALRAGYTAQISTSS